MGAILWWLCHHEARRLALSPTLFWCVRSVRRNAILCSSCGTVNSTSRQRDCEHDAKCLRARVGPGERHSCHGDPRESSALALPVMDTGSRPNGRPTTWLETAPVRGDPSASDPRSQLGFDVPTTAFAILKGGFHPHTPGIELHLSVTCSLIADEQPWFLVVFVPQQADTGLQCVFLPDRGPAIPAIATRCRTI